MIPKQVKIGGITFSVEIAESRPAEGGFLMGEITYMDTKIYLNEKCTSETMQQTFLHEVVHGIMHMMGRKDLNEDEWFVDALSLNLYQIFKDNGWTLGTQTKEEQQ